MEMNMWCVCRKKDGRPIKVMVDEEAVTADVIGFATKQALIKAAGMIEEDEVIKKITFEY